MSGASGGSYSSSFRSTRSTLSSDEHVRAKATEERTERISKAKATVEEKTERVKRDNASQSYDRGLVMLKITKPAAKTKKVYLFVIDNSGSNKMIADHIKSSAEYITTVLMQLEPQAQFAWVYGSDHGDGALMAQEIDFHFPDENGAKILFSTVSHIRGAHGQDEAEAFECILYDACEYDFGNVEEKHLILVTDQVAHGMGYTQSDHGCPYQRSWQGTKKRVYETFNTFTVVGCSNSDLIGQLQKGFLQDDRVALDLIDLSGVPEHRHRLGLSGNALLFLVARNSGKQGVELFLSFLYEKWLTDPVFGGDTERRAKEGIRRFGKFLPYPEKEIEEMMERIIV